MIENEEEAIKYIIEKGKELSKIGNCDPTEYFAYINVYEDEKSVLSKELTELKEISPNLKKNKNFVLKALDTGYFGLISVSPELYKDEEVCLKAIKNRGARTEFIYIDDKLKNNEKFMLKAIQLDPKSIMFVGDKLKQYDTFLNTAIAQVYCTIEMKKKEQKEASKNNEEDFFEYSGMGPI